VADRIAVMEHGKIIEEGPASKILDSPSTERVKAFLKLIRK